MICSSFSLTLIAFDRHLKQISYNGFLECGQYKSSSSIDGVTPCHAVEAYKFRCKGESTANFG
jgi:hypothetical protein